VGVALRKGEAMPTEYANLADWSPERSEDAPRSITFALNNSTSDAEQIISFLAYFAGKYGKSPAIMEFAGKLIRNIRQNNFVEEQYSRVASFVLDRVTYVADPRGAEYVRSPVTLLRQFCQRGFAQGDCDDMTLLTASLLTALGFKVRIVAVKINGSDYYNHVLNQVMVRGQWKWFDACNKDNPTKQWTDFILKDVT